jgi:tetratricopeptide (TPR) repeat protein
MNAFIMRYVRVMLLCLLLFTSTSLYAKGKSNCQVVINDIPVKISSFKATQLYRLGLGKVKLRDFKTALIHFTKANEIEPNNINILNSLANIHDLLGNSIMAEEIYTKTLNMNKSHVETYINYSNHLFEKKKFEEAKNLLIQTEDFKINNEKTKALLFYSFGITYYNLKEYGKALSYGKKARTLYKKEDMKTHIDELIKKCTE